MSVFSGDGTYVQCPLCEGKGQLYRSDVVAKLTDKELPGKINSYLTKLYQAAEGKPEPQPAEPVTAGAPPQSEFEKEAHSWPMKRFLWRRSPKE